MGLLEHAQDGPCIDHAQMVIEPIGERSHVDFRSHDLRRTAARLVVHAGVPRLAVSKILNHIDDDATTLAPLHRVWHALIYAGRRRQSPPRER